MMTEAVTEDDDECVEEEGYDDNHAHDDDEGEDLVTGTAAGTGHIVTLIHSLLTTM